MSFTVFKIFQLFGVVSSWATQALADGVVTLTEAVSLVTQLCAIIGVTPQLDLPGINTTTENVPDNPGTVATDTNESSPVADPDRAPPEDISPKLRGIT